MLHLLQFSDPHLFAQPDGELRGVRTLSTFRSTVAHALSVHGRPDAILVTGDIAQDESADAYRHFRDSIARAGVPVLCLPGNHDDPAVMRDMLDRPPLRFCGQVQSEHWIVVTLSTHVRGQSAGLLGDNELSRLSATLEDNRRRHALIALHHHPVASGSAWVDELALKNSTQLFAILQRHPQTRACVFGHIHQVVQARHGDIAMLSAPSTCDQFRRDSDLFAVDDRPPGYRWLRLHADGMISTAVRWCKGDHATP